MTERLAAIESTLIQAQISFPINHSHSNEASDISTMPGRMHGNESQGGRGNPLETAGEVIAVEGLVDLSATRNDSNHAWGIRPDVLDRGILTIRECEDEFDLFFQHIHPWAAFLSNKLDRQPLIVRARSPLLFHAILITTL